MPDPIPSGKICGRENSVGDEAMARCLRQGIVDLASPKSIGQRCDKDRQEGKVRKRQTLKQIAASLGWGLTQPGGGPEGAGHMQAMEANTEGTAHSHHAARLLKIRSCNPSKIWPPTSIEY